MVSWKGSRKDMILFFRICGESKEVDATVSQWMKDLSSVLKGYSPDIFNADKTNLFFECLPNSTFTYKGLPWREDE